MLRLRGWKPMLVGAAVLFLGVIASVQCKELVNEVFPRRALVTPVLVMDVNLGTEESQEQPFYFSYSGRYSVNAQLKLRHGPQGMPAETRKFVLAGSAEILNDEERSVALKRDFERSVLEYEVGTELFEFNTDEVGLEGPKTFRVAVRIAPEFREHYSNMKVFIKKEMKYPILD
jgi:hypothetical protein